MKIYLYAKSGHAIGLEATKKCAVLANLLEEFDPILCTSDFRAGAFAKENLGIKKYVNIDVMRNLTNIMQKNDILFYISDEANEQMKKDIDNFCSLSYDLEENLNAIIVDTKIYTKTNAPLLEKTIFFGDDDYNNIFFEMIKESKKFDLNLLMGHYFFLGNEKIFANYFSNIIDEEEYVQTIKNSKFLLTSSLQSACESIACGNKPVLFKREDKIYNDDLILKLNIPVVEYSNINELISNFERIIKEYPKLQEIKITDFGSIILKAKEKIDIFKKLTNL